MEAIWHRLRKKNILSSKRSALDNIFHCSIHKAASQWFYDLFEDPIFYKNTTLSTYKYQTVEMDGFDPRPMNTRFFEKPFPIKTVGTPLYISYACYQSIPKPTKYKTIFVVRDPKDALVSWYFSMRDSHPVLGKVSSIRSRLTKLSLEDGLLYSIDELEKQAYFECIASWMKADLKENERIILFEDLVISEEKIIYYLLDFFSISLSFKDQFKLIDRHRFSAKKKKMGNYDHYRKGRIGEWKNHLSYKVNNLIEEILMSHDIDYVSITDRRQLKNEKNRNSKTS